jgi:hypothetical protein
VRKLVRGVRGSTSTVSLRDAKAAGVRRQANATPAEANRLRCRGRRFFFTMGAGPDARRPRALDGPSVAAMLDTALGASAGDHNVTGNGIR